MSQPLRPPAAGVRARSCRSTRPRRGRRPASRRRALVLGGLWILVQVGCVVTVWPAVDEYSRASSLGIDAARRLDAVRHR